MMNKMYYPIYDISKEKECPVCGEYMDLSYRIEPGDVVYKVDGVWGGKLQTASLRLYIEVFMNCSSCDSEIRKAVYGIEMPELNLEIQKILKEYVG